MLVTSFPSKALLDERSRVELERSQAEAEHAAILSQVEQLQSLNTELQQQLHNTQLELEQRRAGEHAHVHMSHMGIHYIIYKYKNHEVGCRDDTVPKTGDTRRHCEVELTVCNNLPQPPPYISFFGGCGRLLHTVNSTSQCLLVSRFWHCVIPTSYF